MKQAKQVVALVVLAVCGATLAAKLPAEYPRCSVRDPDFSACLSKAFETVLHRLKEGEKSLGLPPIGPLIIDEMTLDLGSGPIPLVLDAKNISIKGLDSSSVKSASLDPATHTLVVKAFSPHLRLDFDYKAKGRILVVAVEGDGPAYFEFENVDTTHTIVSEPFEKKGKTYWKIKEYSVDISPAGMVCHFQELLKGNAQVSEQVNNVLNTEWKLFYQQIKAPAAGAFGEIFKAMATRVFDRVPIADVYLDIDS